MCMLDWFCVIYTNSEGSGESSQGYTGSPMPYVTRQSTCNKYMLYQTLLLAQSAILVPCMTAANALASLHICTGAPEPS